MVADSQIHAFPSSDGGVYADYHLRYGIGQGCAMTPGMLSNGAMLVFSALGVVTLVARRRRSSR